MRRYEISLREMKDEKRNVVSRRDHVIFFLIHKNLTIDKGIFGDFSKISDHFPNISEDSPKVFHRPNIAGDFRRRSIDVSIIH